MRCEVYRAGHDEWALMLFAELSPVADIRKNVLVCFEFFLAQCLFLFLV